MEIAASLWIKPATLEELCQRDFLSGKAEYGVFRLLNMGREKGWIYQRNEVYYTYKTCVVDVLNPSGFELTVQTDNRTDFQKEFDRAKSRS